MQAHVITTKQRRKVIDNICSEIFAIAAFTGVALEKDLQAQIRTQCFSQGLPVLLAVFSLEPAQHNEEAVSKTGLSLILQPDTSKGKSP